MNAHRFKRNPTLVALYGATAFLAACGSGSDSSTPVTPPVTTPVTTTVTGVVAATGAPLGGATVTLVDADAATANPAAATTGSDGKYSFVVDGLKAPFAVRAVYTQDGQSKTLYSILPSATANASNTANVTPLSNAVAVLVAPAGDPSALTDPAQLTSALTGANATAFNNAVASLNAVLASDPATASALAAAAGAGNTFNPVTTGFNADEATVLDRLTVTANPYGSAAGTIQVQNNAQAVTGSPPAAPVTITSATTPATAPTLPPTASGDLPSGADLDAFAKRLNDCFALPATQRVTSKDASGNTTAIATICNFAVADFKQNGYSWMESQGSLANANLDGAVFQRPTIALVLPASHRTGAKEFKHPYCDQAQCVVVDSRGTMPAADNQPFRRTDLLAKTSAGWQTVGNQRPYDFDIEYRLNRYVFQNPAPTSPTNYFSKSRFEANLRTRINPSGPGMNNVRAARITGPGLPAAGIVLSRSSRCTSDRLAIVSKTGDTFVVDNGVNVPRYWTGNAGNDFKVGGALLDGSEHPAGTWPSSVDYATAPDSADAVVPYGQYKWEFFNFGSATPSEPDLIVYQRLIVTDTDLNRFVDTPALWWAALDAANINDYLIPTGARAGALTDVSVSWTVPSSLGRVDSAFIFSQNNAIVNGINYNKRTGFSPIVAKPGDTTASITGGKTLWVSGVSTSSFTRGIVAAQNPRCDEADKSLVPLTGVPGDYREISLTTTLTSGVRLSSINYWSP